MERGGLDVVSTQKSWWCVESCCLIQPEGRGRSEGLVGLFMICVCVSVVAVGGRDEGKKRGRLQDERAI